MALTNEEIQKHSLIAFKVWKQLWIDNCRANKPKIATSQRQILGKFKDKPAILFAYGPSFEENIDYLKSQNFARDRYVVGCVDKAYRPLCERGIVPDFVLLADGTVDPKKWLYGVDPAFIKQTILLSNVYGQPGWSDFWIKHSSKENIFWYLNKDNIACTPNNRWGTAEFFAPIANYFEVIEAGSNVGNSLVIVTRKIFGCRTIYLMAYDYSWDHGEYYGTEQPNKRYQMPTNRVVDMNNDIVFSNLNMEFSAQWLDAYIIQAKQLHGTDIINLTGRGILRNNCMRKAA